MAFDSELLDIAQAAALLRVSEASLRRWTNAGRLPCRRIGGRRERRFRRADLMAFLEGDASETPARHAGPVRAGPKSLTPSRDTPSDANSFVTSDSARSTPAFAFCTSNVPPTTCACWTS